MRETFQYHYVYAVARMWRRLRDPLALLEQALALGERVIAGADVVRPRLLRDLHFACARLCERLGAWERSRFQAACEHYRRGLDIRGRGIETERGPRGRALSDLANTLHHSGHGTPAETEALFSEAVQLLPACEPGPSGAAVRLNYAIFLFERIERWAPFIAMIC